MGRNNNRKQNNRRRNPRGVAYCLAWGFALMAVAAMVCYVVMLCVNFESAAEVRAMLMNQMHASVGDLVAGTVGICLSFSATLFMFVTFREQRRQFDAGRRDAGRERFESTFFNMLSMLYNVRESVNAEISRRTEASMSSISDYYEGFHKYYAGCTGRRDLEEVASYLEKGELNVVELEKAEQTIGGLYEEYMHAMRCDIGYYYRYVFNTINFVIDHWMGVPGGEADIHRYLNLLQAQMSDDELGLVFYDALSNKGLDKHYEHRFKSLLDTSGFLENINSSALLSRSHHILYSGTIFRFLNRDEREAKRAASNFVSY